MRRASVVGAEELAKPVSEVSPTGKHVEFPDFYRAEMPGLVALARGLCGSAVADDIAQEAMLAAYRRWEEVQRFEEPHAWVRRTCANLAISAFRRRMVEVRGLARVASRPEVPAIDEVSQEFWVAVRSLPRRQAQCAALRFIYQLSGDEIARTLGITEGSVKVHLARARHALATALGIDKEDQS